MSFALISAAAILAASPSASAAVINFDNLATVPVALTNQYASSGVVFDQIEAAASFKFNIIPPSTPNYASPFWTSTNPGTIEFVDPSNPSVGAITDSVSITLVGLTTPPAGFYSGATIDAFDAGGNIIAGQSQVIPGTSTATSNVTITFTGEIHELRFTHTAGTSGAFPFDNLTFDAVTPTPEPATMALFASAMTALGLWRRKNSLR